MTIDKSKQLLSHYQRLFNSLNGDYRLSIVQAAELSHAIDTALDAVCMYQKIQEIVKNADTSSTIYSSLAFSEIRKVVEDGIID